ncbi:MAG: IS1182 family transposase [Pyrinomonadaceae bacterium]|nr:IS1182 family transposase [Sphingobacteriaceae bacterium]
MQGKKNYQEKLFVSFQLSSYVPQDNFYRKLKELLNLDFLYSSTSEYYGFEGQKSIDPVVFMKLMLVGYLENMNSDRRIISLSRMRLDILYFIGYDIDEELPWHSTLSRTRQLYREDIFTALFKKVLKQCIDKGMVSGRRQAVDGVFVKANASLDSMVEKEILDDAALYSQELKENEQEEETPVLKLDAPCQIHHTELKPNKNPGNDTHYSPSDPDARMSVKPGKATALNYLGQVSVDTASHVITHIEAFTAEKRDSECLSAVVMKVKNTLLESQIALEEIVADKGYSSADALKALEGLGVTGYIPNRGQFNYQRKGFTYNQEGEYYTCINKKVLHYKATELAAGYWMKRYSLSTKECANCPFTDECSAFNIKNKHATIRETIDKPYYDRMHVRMQTRKAKILLKKRQSTVEPVIGTLVNYLGMKRVNTKGLEQANKCLTMSAIAYNLKKLLKHTSRHIQGNVQKINHLINKELDGFTYDLLKQWASQTQIRIS